MHPADPVSSSTGESPLTPGQQPPVMSIILPADRPETIMGVLRQLRIQTIVSGLEIVIATSNPAEFESLHASQYGFHSIKVLPMADDFTLGAARAKAMQAAGAACVFLGETHSFAAVPRWAELLVARHRDGWAVIVPGFRNANPASRLSWAGFLLDYGGWLERQPSGEIEYWPLNNSACDRLAILNSTDNPAHALSYGDQLILALRTAGHKVYFEPEAVLSHFNLSHLREWLDERYIAGHLIARARSNHWSWFRRWTHVLAAPAIALVLFGRVSGSAWRTIRARHLSWSILPLMLLGTITQAIGELLGYAHLGDIGSSERRMTEYEIHKVSYT